MAKRAVLEYLPEEELKERASLALHQKYGPGGVEKVWESVFEMSFGITLRCTAPNRYQAYVYREAGIVRWVGEVEHIPTISPSPSSARIGGQPWA